MARKTFREQVLEGIPATLPPKPSLNPEVNHAPRRKQVLDDREKAEISAVAKIEANFVRRFLELQRHE